MLLHLHINGTRFILHFNFWSWCFNINTLCPQAHGRPSMRSLVQSWNKMLQKEMEHILSTKTDAAAAFLASLEEPKLTSLADAAKKPPIEILPPGMASLYGPNPGQTKTPIKQGLLQKPDKPLLLEGSKTTPPNATVPPENGTTPTSEPGVTPNPEAAGASVPESDTPSVSASNAPPPPEPGAAQPAPPQPDAAPQQPESSEVAPESSSPAPVELNQKASDNQATDTSLLGTSEPLLTPTGQNVPSTSNSIPSSVEVGSQQQPDNKGRGILDELQMIDFS